MNNPDFKLNVSSLENAAITFETGLARFQQAQDDLMLRDACIQRFEYCYELAVRFLMRQLPHMPVVREPVKEMNYKTMIRYAAEAGLIQSAEQWFLFRELRNITSHAYDPQKAKHLEDIFMPFLLELQHVIVTLKKLNL